MVSFLRGTALDYFEPSLSADCEPAWLSNFPLFRSKLEQLVMKDNHKAVRFFVEFNRIVSRLSDEYGESALLRHAYLALPKCLKDKIV